LCLGAWKRCEQLQKCAELIDCASDEAIEVPLLEHVIASEHHPCLEILLDKVLVQRLEFSLDVRLHLQAGVLTIRGGRIEAVVLGNAEAKRA